MLLSAYQESGLTSDQGSGVKGRGQGSEVRGPKSGVRVQGEWIRCQRSGVGGPRLNPLRSFSSKNLTGQAGIYYHPPPPPPPPPPPDEPPPPELDPGGEEDEEMAEEKDDPRLFAMPDAPRLCQFPPVYQDGE